MAAITRSEEQARGQQSDNYAQRWLQLSLAELALHFSSVGGGKEHRDRCAQASRAMPKHPTPCPSIPCHSGHEPSGTSVCLGKQLLFCSSWASRPCCSLRVAERKGVRDLRSVWKKSLERGTSGGAGRVGPFCWAADNNLNIQICFQPSAGGSQAPGTGSKKSSMGAETKKINSGINV